MKLLFLTLLNIESINERNLYSDLMRKFRDEGHDVFIVAPSERRFKQKTHLLKKDGISILKVKIPNYQKTNIFEKGISVLLIEYLFLSGVKRYFSYEKFDLVMYSTPPITFTKVIRFIKKRNCAVSYLLLKDIFPQNAVDLGIIRGGSLIHRYFVRKEKWLYQISDFIGCMSPANMEYIIKHNPEIDSQRVEVNPNCIDIDFLNKSNINKPFVRQKYNIPLNSTVFVYGGNLGKPQGIDFLIEVLGSNKYSEKIFFVIVGDGTEYQKIFNWFKINQPANAILLNILPKDEYDELVQAGDIGLIFLDKRFTIPNFPSRILSYMENKMAILAATDKRTDLGKIIEQNNFGFWVESGDLNGFNDSIAKLSSNSALTKEMGRNGFEYLVSNYSTFHSYSLITNHLKIDKTSKN